MLLNSWLQTKKLAAILRYLEFSSLCTLNISFSTSDQLCGTFLNCIFGSHNQRFDIKTKVKIMQRPGSEAIRTQIQPCKPKREISKITNSKNTNRTYGQPSMQLFPERWPLCNPDRSKINMNTRKVKGPA